MSFDMSAILTSQLNGFFGGGIDAQTQLMQQLIAAKMQETKLSFYKHQPDCNICKAIVDPNQACLLGRSCMALDARAMGTTVKAMFAKIEV